MSDPDDDQVLACGLTANAALIVSGDEHLLELGTFHNTRILGARAALDAIFAASG